MAARGPYLVNLPALSLALLLSSAAWAQGSEAAARVLFEEARAMMAKKDFAAACPKLAESPRLDPGVGTRFNLARCYAEIDKLASAWLLFNEVAEQTEKAGEHKRAALARKRAAALRPRLSRMLIEVERPVANMQIRRNGEPVGSAQWGTKIPLDNSSYQIEASADGFTPWQQRVSLEGEGGLLQVKVPPLSAAQTTPSAPAPTQLIAAAAVGGLGLVGVGLGTAFGIMASSSNDEAGQYCNADNACSQEGVDLNAAAKTQATVSTVSFIAGGAAIATATILLLTAPSAASSEPQVGLVIGPAGAGLTLSSRF